MKPPISRRYLDIAIERLAGRFGEARIQQKTLDYGAAGDGCKRDW